MKNGVFWALALVVLPPASHAGIVTYTELDSLGAAVGPTLLSSACDASLAVGGSCTAPAFAATGTHFSVSGSFAAQNVDGLNTTLTANAVVTSIDGARGSVKIQWVQMYQPYFAHSAPTLVTARAELIGSFSLASPSTGDNIKMSMEVAGAFSGLTLPMLAANAADGSSFSLGPSSLTYLGTPNGNRFDLTTTFNFLGVSISSGDKMDIPVNASIAAAVPEPSQWGLMLAGLGFVGMSLFHRRQAGPA